MDNEQPEPWYENSFRPVNILKKKINRSSSSTSLNLSQCAY